VSWWGSQPSMFRTRSYLNSLWRPHAKRQGIGRELFNWAVSRCPKGLTLKTLVENSESRAFYRGLGMVEGNRSVNTFNGREEIEHAL